MMSWDFCPISNTYTHTHTHTHIFINNYIDANTTKYIDGTVCIYIDRHEGRLSEPSQPFKEKGLSGTIHCIMCRWCILCKYKRF